MIDGVVNAIRNQLSPLEKDGLISSLNGLIEDRTTDAFAKGKQLTLPVPIGAPDLFNDSWKTLVPDPEKTHVIYFEPGNAQIAYEGANKRMTGSVRLISWFNANKLSGVESKYDIENKVITQLTKNKGQLSVDEIGPGQLQILKLLTINVFNSVDPFTRFTVYRTLTFDYKAYPYGYFVLDLNYKAYACG